MKNLRASEWQDQLAAQSADSCHLSSTIWKGISPHSISKRKFSNLSSEKLAEVQRRCAHELWLMLKKGRSHDIFNSIRSTCRLDSPVASRSWHIFTYNLDIYSHTIFAFNIIFLHTPEIVLHRGKFLSRSEACLWRIIFYILYFIFYILYFIFYILYFIFYILRICALCVCVCVCCICPLVCATLRNRKVDHPSTAPLPPRLHFSKSHGRSYSSYHLHHLHQVVSHCWLYSALCVIEWDEEEVFDNLRVSCIASQTGRGL